MDFAYQLLISAIKQSGADDLIIADESFPCDTTSIVPTQQLQCLSNRYEIAESLQSICETSYFNDFDLTCLNKAPNHIFYRISKEKAVTHHIINESLKILPVSGKLFLAGYKNDGIKTYIDKTKKLFTGSNELINGEKSAKMAIFTKQNSNQDVTFLDDKNYQEIREINSIKDTSVVSKPGVFGWNKIDPGSAFLIEQLPNLLINQKRPPQKVLDLGCGYGYIALQAFYQNEKLKQSHFVLTDNNAAAIRCAQQNITTHGLSAEAVADDCGKHLNDKFELILTNPPFHKGFDVSNDISSHFINNIHRLLTKDGTALLVVNQFVGIEKRAANKFAHLSELARNKSFKLIVLAGPK